MKRASIGKRSQVLRDAFQGDWIHLNLVLKSLILGDISLIEKEEQCGVSRAVKLLFDRIGGSGNLRSYAMTLAEGRKKR